ncbi:MAG: electron transfer flavoprotein subunit beta/FixA family protein, partial [Gemmatimonadales bacterium]
KICVCVKRTPDTESRIKIGADGKSIDQSGVKFVLNPYDEYAVEEALRLKEASGSGEVVVLGVGPEQSQEVMRTALAMGADRGVLLKTDNLPPDPLPIAHAIADEIRDGGFDLVLCGKMAIDDYHHAVGTMVGELLGVPAVSAVSRLEIAGGRATAEREIEGGVEVVEFALPAVVTADKGLNEPRYPALRGIMMAKKKPLDIKEVTLAAGAVEVAVLSLPPAREEGRIVGEGPDAVPALVEALRSEAKVI